jgi:hypothetical protein
MEYQVQHCIMPKIFATVEGCSDIIFIKEEGTWLFGLRNGSL